MAGSAAGHHPFAQAVGVAVWGQFAEGIQQHDGDGFAFDHGLHDQAAARFVDVTGLAQLDVPAVVLQQAVGVDVSYNFV